MNRFRNLKNSFLRAERDRVLALQPREVVAELVDVLVQLVRRGEVLAARARTVPELSVTWTQRERPILERLPAAAVADALERDAQLR